MKAKSFFFFATLFQCIAGVSQNLVPNGSFEENSGCPKTAAQLEFCDDWLEFRNTPDYYHECSLFMGVPSNVVAYQEAKDGVAYAGITCFWISNADYKEHLGVELIEPMQIGTTYYASYWISKSEKISTDLACDNLGIRFSTNVFWNGDSSPLQNWAHILNEEIVTDTANWVQIKGAFIADSTYSYMAIGNFFSDANTDTLQLEPETAHDAYYLVDDVRLSTDSLFAYGVGISEVNELTSILLFPNPCTEQIQAVTNQHIKSWSIINAYGVFVSKGEANQSSFLQIPLENLSSGVYAIQIRLQSNQVISKTFIKE